MKTFVSNKTFLRRLMGIAMLISLLALTACGTDKKDASDSGNKSADIEARYTHLSMDEAQEMIESGKPGKDYILLDTREVNVYNHDHIPGAICIPEPEISKLDNDAQIKELPDKDARIIVYCQFGGVSKIAAEKLCDMGYTDIYEFDGMDYWEGEVEYGDYCSISSSPSAPIYLPDAPKRRLPIRGSHSTPGSRSSCPDR